MCTNSVYTCQFLQHNALSMLCISLVNIFEIHEICWSEVSDTYHIANVSQNVHEFCEYVDCNSQNFLYEDFIVKHTVHNQQEYQRTIAAVNAVEMKVKYSTMMWGPDRRKQPAVKLFLAS